MAIRVYICPWIGTGSREDPYRSKAYLYHDNLSSFLPSRLSDGAPASPWVVSFIRDDDFTEIDADATCDDLFAGDLPANVTTREELLAFLRARTIGDVPVGRRAAVQAVLDKYGIVRSDFTLSTPLWRLMRRVASTLFEQDDNFASAF